MITFLAFFCIFVITESILIKNIAQSPCHQRLVQVLNELNCEQSCECSRNQHCEMLSILSLATKDRELLGNPVTIMKTEF